MNHKGRDGQPSVLIVGDEATPSTVGYTGKDRNDGRGDSCAWVLKVEHLGLEEVSNVLQKINQEKKLADKESGKREHDFFLSNGSKILVSSFTHLRKEGIEDYIKDFNQMVRNVQGVVGRADIEILPVVPVVREGVDKVGRVLLSMVGEWIDWIGVLSERESVRRLSRTGGREWDKQDEGTTFIWRPSFLMKVGTGIAGRSGELKMLGGGTTETVVRAACVTTELERLRGGDTSHTRGDVRENAKKTTCEKNGVSMEGEFVFLQAVGEFLREEVRVESFRGNYMLNLKEQMRMRCLRESGEDKRLRVLMVGASQMGRIGDELSKMHGEKVRVVGRVRMSEEHTADQHMEMLKEVALRKEEVDVVIIGGPTNSLVRHGKEGERGFGGERQVRVVKNSDGEDEWTVTYHMTDPVRITMTEKVELVESVVELECCMRRCSRGLWSGAVVTT